MKYIHFIHNEKNYWGELLSDKAVKAYFQWDEKQQFSFLMADYSPLDMVFPLNEAVIQAPVIPNKIIGIGLNYREHAKEFQMELPKEPLFFLKSPSSLIGPNEKIILPNVSKRVDYEAEIAVIIKKKCKNISVDKAEEVILGYTCFNDITARDLQKKDGQWSRAKSFDTFSSLGPVITDEINPLDREIKLIHNGEIKQYGNTNDMIFNVFELVSYLSRMMTLFPGDVIATGTPPGVGKLSAGDTVTVSIDGIGDLVNSVIDES